MIDKFLLFLSLDCFATCFFPLGNQSALHIICKCAQNEASKILRSKAGYYERDMSKARTANSKSSLLTSLRNQGLPNPGIDYISYLWDLFDHNTAERKIISLTFGSHIDRLLALDVLQPSITLCDAVQKLHSENIFSSHQNIGSLIEDSFSNNTSAWLTKLQDPRLFDGVEDAIQEFSHEVLEGYTAFPFFCLVARLCSRDEATQIIASLSDSFLRHEASTTNLVEIVIPGLNTQSILA